MLVLHTVELIPLRELGLVRSHYDLGGLDFKVFDSVGGKLAALWLRQATNTST
jgi:hypothetical protein